MFGMGFQEPIHLNVLIVGAGIAGLTAATALKHAGHKVTLFESSHLLREVGAAITLAPNGTRVLSALDFDFEAARGVTMDSVKTLSGITLDDLKVYPEGAMEGIETKVGFPYRAFHRVDLHGELVKMALRRDGKGEDVELLMGVKIVRVDIENAEVELSDGRIWKGDLLIGADGLHSLVRKTALGVIGDGVEEQSKDVGWNIYRWLLDTEEVLKDPELKAMMTKGRNTYVVPYKGRTLRLVWYSCRNGEVQNFATFCPSEMGQSDEEDYDQAADKTVLFAMFSDLHPALRRLMSKSDSIKTWRLRDREPLPTYIYGRTIIIGDAAHPMLPFNAQAGCQAIEDCGALLILFSDLYSKDEIPKRMKLFDQVRRKRANRQQIVSSVPAEEVKNLGEKLRDYVEEGPPESADGEGMRERLIREFEYNVLEKSREALVHESLGGIGCI